MNGVLYGQLWGLKSDLPIVGDWDGDNDETPGLTRIPNAGSPYLQWILDNQFDQFQDADFLYGLTQASPRWDRPLSAGTTGNQDKPLVERGDGLFNQATALPPNGSYQFWNWNPVSPEGNSSARSNLVLVADWDYDSFDDYISAA